MGQQSDRENPNGRRIIAALVVYLIVLRAVFSPFLANAAEADARFASFFVLCSSHSAESGAAHSGSGTPALPPCCTDDGYCCMMSMAGFVPPVLASSRVFWVPVQAIAKVRYELAPESTGPPVRIAAHPQAQRAPPLI